MRSGIIRDYSSRIAENVHQIVVVADDDPAFRMLLRVNLELEGFEVVEAASAQEVKEALRAREVALVLLDVRLGEDDGILVAGDLRKEHPALPIALLTGSAAGLDESSADYDAVIWKPFELPELIATVGRLTRR
jgi:DNA-binding response OmpR family regulator